MKMIDILVIEKSGKIKEVSLKKCITEEFYKKAGFKKADGFNCLHTWNLDEFNGNEYHISLYGKKEGRAGQENKYEVPPPLDNDLLFGNLILVNQVDDKYVSFSSKEWKKIYDHLYGGFEDLEEESEEEETDEDDGIPKTKSGYAKDGFVVDESDEAGDESFEDETEEELLEDGSEPAETDGSTEDEKIYKRKRNIVTRSKSTKKKEKRLENVFINLDKTTNSIEFSSELVEEDYI